MDAHDRNVIISYLETLIDSLKVQGIEEAAADKVAHLIARIDDLETQVSRLRNPYQGLDGLAQGLTGQNGLGQYLFSGQQFGRREE